MKKDNTNNKIIIVAEAILISVILGGMGFVFNELTSLHDKTIEVEHHLMYFKEDIIETKKLNKEIEPKIIQINLKLLELELLIKEKIKK